MRPYTFALAIVGSALLLAAAPAAAQDGFALKGGAVFNRNAVDAAGTERLPDASGFSLGAEVVLPGGIGVGVSGYTAGHPRDFETSSGSLVFLGEANYFLRLPMLPLSPYAGVHVGLGRYDFDDLRDGPRPEVDFGDLGYQVGVRFQPTALIGIDAQYRRVSGSLEGYQESSFDTDQVLVGITIF